MRATDIVGAHVEDSYGRPVGSVIDLVLAPHDPGVVTHLVVGGSTFIGRFSVLRGGRRGLGRLGAEDVLPIEDVARIEPGHVVVKRVSGHDRGGGAAARDAREEARP